MKVDMGMTSLPPSALAVAQEPSRESQGGGGPELYKIHKGYEWAHVFIDEGTGTFSAVSSFGNFAHIWAYRGNETLKEFLQDLEYDYFMSKTAPSRGRMFSAKETTKYAKEQILECRRTSLRYTKQDARDAWEDLDAIDDMASADHYFHEFTASDAIMKFFGDCYWEMGCNADDPQCRGFWYKIWPEVKASIAKALSENTIRASAEGVSDVTKNPLPEGVKDANQDEMVLVPRELQELSARATQGQWEAIEVNGTLSVMPQPETGREDTFLGVCGVYDFEHERSKERTIANAQFIAATVNYVRALLKEARNG